VVVVVVRGTTDIEITPLPGLVRFVPKGDDSKVLIGEPADAAVDVGAAVRKGEDVKVKVYSGKSVLDFGAPTGETASIGRILSPLAQEEVGTIRCIGLNVSGGPGDGSMRACGGCFADGSGWDCSTRSTPRRPR
jgi:hypothetical protein